MGFLDEISFKYFKYYSIIYYIIFYRDLPGADTMSENSANESGEKDSTIDNSEQRKMYEEEYESETDNSKSVKDSPVVNKDPDSVSEKSTEQPDSTTLDGQIEVSDIHAILDHGTNDNIFCNEALEDFLESIPNNSPDNDESSEMMERLLELKKMYTKYFNKAVQDNTVIIGHILNMIALSKKQLVLQTNKAINNDEKIQAERLHAKQKEVLEYRLYLNFVQVVIMFDEDDYNLAFLLFFLCIFMEFKVFDDPPEVDDLTIFRDLTQQILSSLKGNEEVYDCIIQAIKSKDFLDDCIDLLRLVENCQKNKVTDKMALLSVSTLVGREHFQAAINLVNTNFDADLGELIDQGQVKFRNKSQFKDPDTSNEHQDPINPSFYLTTPLSDYELATLR